MAAGRSTPGFYKELIKNHHRQDSAINGAGLLYCFCHDTPNRMTRHLVRNSPLKQARSTTLLDLLAPDNKV
jgi:hypothetical protein